MQPECVHALMPHRMRVVLHATSAHSKVNTNARSEKNNWFYFMHIFISIQMLWKAMSKSTSCINKISFQKCVRLKNSMWFFNCHILQPWMHMCVRASSVRYIQLIRRCVRVPIISARCMCTSMATIFKSIKNMCRQLAMCKRQTISFLLFKQWFCFTFQFRIFACRAEKSISIFIEMHEFRVLKS